MTRFASACLLLGCLLVNSAKLLAHPVPKESYDRVILVRLFPNKVQIDYRLEIDDWTIVYRDLPAVNDKFQRADLKKPSDYYSTFTRCYAPILCDNLTLKIAGRTTPLQVVEHKHQQLDHIRCDFRFEAQHAFEPGQIYAVSLHEGNYELERGRLDLSLVAESSVTLLEKQQADEATKNRPESEQKPGDEKKLRLVTGKFQLAEHPATSASPLVEPENEPNEAPAPTSLWVTLFTQPQRFVRQLLEADTSFWLACTLVFVWGGAHALTPGHGKSMIAAYLVGERGTWRHVLFLGLITTITHTGSVLVFAYILVNFVVTPEQKQQYFAGLELLSGLLLAGLGCTLFFQRLRGWQNAANEHSHGHGHGHTHGTGFFSHSHGPLSSEEGVGWGRLLVLAVSGSLVPCPGALTLLLLTLTNLAWAIPLLLCFSLGLASVIIVLGMSVLTGKDLLLSRWEASPRFAQGVKVLPLLSAVLIFCVGLALARASLQAGQLPRQEVASQVVTE